MCVSLCNASGGRWGPAEVPEASWSTADGLRGPQSPQKAGLKWKRQDLLLRVGSLLEEPVAPRVIKFLDFLLPTEAPERDAILSRDRRISNFHTISSCCCCCCSAEGTQPCCCSSNDACVAQLLLREVNAHRELEVQRKILAASPDFKLLAAFQFLEDPKIAAVTPLSLAEALEAEGFFLRPSEVELIFRRLDRSGQANDAGTVSCACCPDSTRLQSTSISRIPRPQRCSRLRSSSSNFQRDDSAAPESFRASECRFLRPRIKPACSSTKSCCCVTRCNSTEIRRSPLLRNNVCKVRSKSCSGNAVASGCEVAGVLSSQIDSERRLEFLREKLALKPDFNLLQFWGLFDTEGRGYAAATHVRDAFNAVGLDISLAQARLFARKLSSDAGPRIRYADMARAFLPTKTRYAEAMINRISNGSHKCPTPQRHLAPETLEIVAAIFDMTLAYGFLICAHSRDGDGYVTAAEFSASLMAHGVCPSEAELNALVNRYDKNGDSKVSYNEFVNEIGRTRCPVGSCRLICSCR
ncbi:hypothetical protein ACSSS7_000437 [Eimeria intestinalis]